MCGLTVKARHCQFESSTFHVKPALPHIDRDRTGGDHPTGREYAFIALIFLAGIALRCLYPSRMAVEHFDEGVYASNFWFDREMDYRYPDQHLYAPPLLPALIEWIFILSGPSNLGAMLPGLVAGCLTVPLVWWVGRSWLGPAGGLSAAALCAFCDPHIVFSRTALTDVPLCFWILLAVHFLWRALVFGGLWSTLAAGLFTALAWWTKYSGWLPLAIGGAGTIPWCIFRNVHAAPKADFGRRSSTQGNSLPKPGSTSRDPGSPERAPDPGLFQSLARWGIIATIAFAAWSPWLAELQSKGGYAAIRANHSRYLVGVDGWLESLATQCRNLTALEGTAGQHAPLAALLVAIVWRVVGDRRFTWNRLAASFWFWLSLGFLLALSAVFPGWMLAGLIGALALVVQFFLVPPGNDPEITDRFRLAFWLIAAWFIGLALSTPFYNPYPRLTLPGLMATWLAGGLACRLILALVEKVADAGESATSRLPGQRAFDRFAPRIRNFLCFGAFGACLVGLGFLEKQAYRRGVPGWDSRTSILRAAASIEQLCLNAAPRTAEANQPYVIYTLSEPGLLFQLKLRGVDEVRPVGSLSLAGPTVPPPQLKSFVILGSLAESLAGFTDQFSAAANRLEPLADVREFDPSLVVRLDSPGAMGEEPNRNRRPEQLPPYIIKVFELH
jgi:hypothetical protein